MLNFVILVVFDEDDNIQVLSDSFIYEFSLLILTVYTLVMIIIL